jgi:hypothetical protein
VAKEASNYSQGLKSMEPVSSSIGQLRLTASECGLVYQGWGRWAVIHWILEPGRLTSKVLTILQLKHPAGEEARRPLRREIIQCMLD